MKAKKGFVEVQFNWIFVLFVGGLLLIFFTSVVLKQKAVSEKSVSASALKSVESIISSSIGVTLDTTNAVKISKTEIGYLCNSISVKDVSVNYNGLIMFAPNVLKGTNLTIQTKIFDIPFRAANFLIASTDDVRYIFVYDDSNPNSNTLKKNIEDSLSNKFNREFVGKSEIENIKDMKNYKVRFVFLYGVDLSTNTEIKNLLNIFSKMPDKDVTAVKFKGNIDYKTIIDYGTIEYYKKKYDKNANTNIWIPIGTQNSVNYLKIPSLLGAIFMDSGIDTVSEYNCVMDNVINRIKLVSNVLSNRIDEINPPSNPQFPKCNTEYTSATSTLTTFNMDINNIKSSPSSLIFNINQIKLQNDNLQSKSCPLIY